MAKVQLRRSVPVMAVAVLALAAALFARSALAARSPCALVTASDAKSALGAAVGKGQLQPLGLYQSCTYATRNGKSLTVQSRAISRAVFDKSAKANPGPVRHVGGLPADAYSVAGGVQLLVWKRGTEVTFLALGVPKPLAVETTLAKKALARL